MALSSQHPGRFLVHSNNEESGHLINTQSMARLKNELNTPYSQMADTREKTGA